MISGRPASAPIRAPRPVSYEETQLGGKLHAIAVRRTQVPLVALRLVFPLTPAQIRKPAPPLLLSESLLAGTARHDRAELAEALGRLGASLGASMAGDTLMLHATVLADRFGEMLVLLNEVLTEASYPAHEVEADRERTADEITIALSHPDALVSEIFARRLYGRHPYGVETPRPHEIESVEATALRHLHRLILEPTLGHLVIVGDISPTRALAAAEELLDEFLEGARRRTAETFPPPPPLHRGPALVSGRAGSVQSNIRIGGSAPPRASEEWAPFSVANAIFGGMFTSRLVENLRERNGYTYAPHSGVEHLRAASHLVVAADVATQVTAPSLLELRYELGRISSTGVANEEVELARRYVIGTFLYRLSSQAGLASMLAGLAASGLSPDYLSSHPARVGAVTKKDVDEAARHYLAPSRMLTVILGDAEAIAPALEAIEPLEVV